MSYREADIKDAVRTTVKAKKNGCNVKIYVAEIKQKAKEVSPELYAWVNQRL